MDLRLIRKATLRLRYGGVSLLIDPDLAPPYSRPSFRGVSPNPLVELPVPPEEAVAGTEAVVVSHLHADHFDGVARKRLSRAVPVFCRSGDEEAIRAMDFADVRPLVADTSWRGVTSTPVAGAHGSGAVLADMGSVTGVVLRHPAEPTVYWAGDTVLIPAVLETIARVRPDVVGTHSCGAVWVDRGYTGEEAAAAAAAHGIRLAVVTRPVAKRGFVLPPRRWVVERAFAWLARCRPLPATTSACPGPSPGRISSPSPA